MTRKRPYRQTQAGRDKQNLPQPAEEEEPAGTTKAKPVTLPQIDWTKRDDPKRRSDEKG